MNGSNSTPRTKRKQHPDIADEHPQKQHRAINGKESAGENTPEVGSVFEDELEIEKLRILATVADTAK
jgi:pro-apoptotic serine protease NMA111